MKYLTTQVVFIEIPDTITLAIDITNCPYRCKGCHSEILQQDIGEELTLDKLSSLIDAHNGIECVCFMGGDSDTSYINEMAKYVKENYNIAVAWYSGNNMLSKNIELKNFDYIKLGEYIEERGGLTSQNTNQKLFKVIHNKDKNDLIELKF